MDPWRTEGMGNWVGRICTLFLLYIHDPPARRKGDALGLQGMKAKHPMGWAAEAMQLPQLTGKKGPALSDKREPKTTEKGIFFFPWPPEHPGCSDGIVMAATPRS